MTGRGKQHRCRRSGAPGANDNDVVLLCDGVGDWSRGVSVISVISVCVISG